MAVAESQDLYVAQYESFAANRAGTDPVWLTTLRRQAMERFARTGFPTPREEDWRFTNVAPIAGRAFARPAPGGKMPSLADLARYGARRLGASLLVFVNGRFTPELSAIRPLPSGVRVASLAEVLQTDPGLVDPYLTRCVRMPQAGFTDLNTAFIEDGGVVHLPADVEVEEPIHLLYWASSPEAAVSHPRTLVVVGDGSRVRLVETYAGEGAGFTNAVTEIVVGDRAVVDHYRVQRESLEAFHVSSTHIYLERDSVFSSHAFTLGGAFTRNDVNATLDGPHVECTLNGLYLGAGDQLVANHTAIDHAQPHCASHEVYKGILDGRARGVFNGKIFVRQDAQKTDAKQTNKVLLLSDDATINTKPQLEIFADDVKCTHGATVGQLDEEMLFYLRTRGIGQADARALLINAFAGEISERVAIEPLRENLEEALLARLPRSAR